MSTVTVKAANSAVQVPREGSRRRKIGSEPVVVELTPYIKRQIADGDLVIVSEPA